jgi:hypothetical protein
VALVRNDVSEERIASISTKRICYLETKSAVADSFHPGDGGDTFLRNVGSYKSHTFLQDPQGIASQKTTFIIVTSRKNLKSYVAGWAL